MKKNIKNLNHLLADLAVFNIKLYNLHWNVVGMHFKGIHEFTEWLYDDVQEDFDALAEHIRMAGKLPLGSLKSYLAHTQLEELEDQEYCGHAVVQILLADVKTLKEAASKARAHADEQGYFETVSLLEDMIASYSKTLWMLDAMARRKEDGHHGHK